MTDCPYCGGELTKSDTFGLGGDEIFEWCDTCGRIINEIDMEEASGKKNKR